MSWLKGEPPNSFQTYIGSHKRLSEIYWNLDGFKTPVTNDGRFYFITELKRVEGGTPSYKPDVYRYAVWLKPKYTRKLPDSFFCRFEPLKTEKTPGEVASVKLSLSMMRETFVLRRKGKWDCVIAKVKEDMDETLKDLYRLEKIDVTEAQRTLAEKKS